jgi:lipopolysaccharide/colanic/teichoic acid biosynthesis glycosyltransferase
MKQRGLARLTKRALDATIAGTALVATAPVMAGAATAIWATMGRPVLFRQRRVGEGERVFEVTKFRTMRLAEEIDPNTDADRITPVGRFLRDSSIDELPQLVNILKGDMSLVGPRPLLERYLPRYDARQRRRHDVLPGLTGWAQVHGRNRMSWEDKFEHDVWYVEHWTPWLDLEILAKTALTVLRRDGISAEGHASMPEFMGSATLDT